MEYLYKLDKYNPSTRNRYNCPSCNKRRYTRYVNSITGEYAPFEFGKCDRIYNCEYHKYPNCKIDVTSIKHLSSIKKPIKREMFYLDKTEYSKKLYRDFDTNYFADYLCSKIGVKSADKLLKEYLIGTGKRGATLFPYLDEDNNLQSYKTITYDLRTGNRVKSINPYYDSNKNKYPYPLFGLQLINKYPDMPIAIAEGEKSAIMMRFYHNSFLWLASGSSNMLNESKLIPIRDRKIILFPDHNEYDNWSKTMIKAQNRFKGIDISISKECEIWYKEGKIKNGGDIADYYNNNYTFCHQQQKIVSTKNEQ